MVRRNAKVVSEIGTWSPVPVETSLGTFIALLHSMLPAIAATLNAAAVSRLHCEHGVPTSRRDPRNATNGPGR
eukprot:CAMPEP_0202108262 /NCGR_PEP_ID=MMETSP0965-20130614/20065_1 /ASSEMBLY_ACC=CAM_ASM_000507 /TAXON_ID=4773 /ORGANISM="Schizochytrium aggregatum, Strain ATCC28209" /LENGTH=72 /DNA_ID=CAMNT_0048677497 /DNA_START=83 /DNA_END=298 /DNA_ORIENTATION=+